MIGQIRRRLRARGGAKPGFRGERFSSRLRVLSAIGLLAFITATGTVGYVLIEGLSWIDALYLTVSTISTVGFGDLVPETNLGRVFTIGLIATGVGSALYLISVIAEDVLEGRLQEFFQRSSMMRKIDALEGHVIVCGFGRYGQVVVDELVRGGRTVLVVESNPEKESELVSAEVLYLIGSASQDDILIEAGIERAETIVVATSDEADSVFITLSAHELNPDIRIHARGETTPAIRRLKRAGATYVNSPYQMGGTRTAASILQPSVVDFLELSVPQRHEEIGLEEVRAQIDSEIIGCNVAEIEMRNSKLRIVGLKRSNRPLELVPGPTEIVQPEDLLVVIGERDDLSRLAREATSPAD